MMNRVWITGLAVLSGFFAACTDDKNVAGSSLETENSIAVNVLLADGSPAARTKVFVRPESFLSGAAGFDSASVKEFNYETDENGNLVVALESGEYVFEARGSSVKAASKLVYDAEDTLNVSLQLNMKKPGSISGQVALPVGVGPVSVGVQGLDYVVKTDSLGNFEFESLPAGDFNVVAFLYSDSTFKNEFGAEEHVERMMNFGIAPAEIKSGKDEDVFLGDSTWTGPEPEDTSTVFMLEDFEDGVDKWYVQAEEYAAGEIESVSAGKGRKGKAAHFTCTNDSLFGWALMGLALGEPVNMSSLDSVSFWVRAAYQPDTTKRTYVSFSFDANVDSTSFGESGKSWKHMDVDTVWTRYVVRVDSMEPVDSAHTGGNFGWYAVRKVITNISIFGGTGGEFWIDDIEFYGMKKFAVKESDED